MVALQRLILFVHDVEGLAAFYGMAFGLAVVERIEGVWAVLQIGPVQLALHRVGEAFRDQPPRRDGSDNNLKLVFTVDRPLAEACRDLAGLGAAMGEIKRFPGSTGPVCDGLDPEGNVFQLVEAPTA